MQPQIIITTCGHFPQHAKGLCKFCYSKMYRAANREWIGAKNEAYRAAHREQRAAYNRVYRAANRERKAAQGKTYYAAKVTPTYRSWQHMWVRCRSPKAKNYFGRGIIVCERWRLFANFLADMGERPEGLTLDRIDNDGNYEPGNCRWATKSEQRRNQRRPPSRVLGSSAPTLLQTHGGGASRR